MGRPCHKVKIEECIEILRDEFSKFPDSRAFYQYPLRDLLTSSYAVFALKHPSLLDFEKSLVCDKRRHNFKTLFKVDKVPSDTQLRDIVDLVDSKRFQPIFKRLFSILQRKKFIEGFEFIRHQSRPFYLIACDGTGYFRSDKVGCSSCNNYDGGEKKKLKKYGHNILGASMVHPDRKEVVPFYPEPIVVEDGKSKNDCEQNAFKRFLNNFRKDHPKLDAVMSLDALYASEPAIQDLFRHELSFIITVKETRGALFMQVNDGTEDGSTKTYEYSYEIGDKVKKQVTRKFRWKSNVHLNQDPSSTRVNFVEFWEEINWEGKRGAQTKKYHSAWVTDLPVTKDTIHNIMQGGRARWKIENETFNTLKNQGYNLEHNYGHGSKFLSVNFVMMMFLAFLVDQVQLISCKTFQKALKTVERHSYLWKKFASQFEWLAFNNWEEFLGVITKDYRVDSQLVPNSS